MDLKSKRTNNTWSLFVSIASGLVLWISNGTEPVCFDFWVPLPGIGYLRWDMALWGFLVELLVIWKCCQGNRLAILLMVFVLLGLPNLPVRLSFARGTSMSLHFCYGGSIVLLVGW